MTNELEKLRKKRLQELQQQQVPEDVFGQQEEQQREFDEQRQRVLRGILTTNARERLGRIKVARPEIAESIENQLITLAQNGRLKSKINDEQLRGILAKILPKKRDIKIQRR